MILSYKEKTISCQSNKVVKYKKGFTTDFQRILKGIKTKKNSPIFVWNWISEISNEPHVTFQYMNDVYNREDIATQKMSAEEIKKHIIIWSRMAIAGSKEQVAMEHLNNWSRMWIYPDRKSKETSNLWNKWFVPKKISDRQLNLFILMKENINPSRNFWESLHM